MKHGAKVWSAVILIVNIVGCGGSKQAPNASSLKRIIGQNDYVEVADDANNIPENLRSIADAVGILSEGCTATHLGGGYVLTAGHCVLPLLYEDDEFPQYNIPCDQTISWGYRSSHQPTLVGKCEKFVTGERNSRNDWAILKVDRFPEAKVAIDQSVDPVSGTQLTLFSHPKHQSLTWSQFCRWDNFEKVRAASPTGFSFDCDLEPGSSGGALIRVDTGKIVGNVLGSGFEGAPSHNIPSEEYNYGQRATSIPKIEDIIARDGSEIVSRPYSGPLAFQVKYSKASVLGLRFEMSSDIFEVVGQQRGHMDVLRDWVFGVAPQALMTSRNGLDFFPYETLVMERSLLLPVTDESGKIDRLTLAVNTKIRRATDAVAEQQEPPLPPSVNVMDVTDLTYFPADRIFEMKLKYSGIFFQTSDGGSAASLSLKVLKPFYGAHFGNTAMVSFDGVTFIPLYDAFKIEIQNNPIGPRANGVGTPTDHEFLLKVFSQVPQG